VAAATAAVGVGATAIGIRRRRIGTASVAGKSVGVASAATSGTKGVLRHE
jgi:hypothetical protein